MFEYTVIFESHAALLSLYKLRNPVDKRLKFSLTATPAEHLQMVVDNMNMRDSGWVIGECITASVQTLSYSHIFCIDALNQIAEAFDTEFEVDVKRVSLKKVEYNRDNPLSLAYGKGKGFRPGVGRTNFEDSLPVSVLYVQGGNRNIDTSKYGSAELLLPKNQLIRYDGLHFEDEDGFVSTNARTYITSADGLSITRQGNIEGIKQDDSVDCSEIYPHRDERILAVITVDNEKNWYDVVTDAPESLDYSQYGIGGETPTIVFQSGMLAGREFDLETDDDGNIICEKYNENGSFIGWKFQIVPAEMDGLTMPGGSFVPNVDDVFRVFGIALPEAYISDDATKSGASWDMFRQGVRYLYDHEDARFTFTGELDGIWSKKDWLNIGGKIKLGGYVSFTNEKFQKDPVLIRITGIKDYINNPYSPEIELSNSTVGGNVSGELNKIENNRVETERLYHESVSFTKRRFRDAKETISMLEDAMLQGFTNSISPITVQTMMMLVGDESLQFRFVDSKTDPQQVVHNIEYDTATKILTISGGIIQHMTLGINSVSVEHKASEYKFWTLPEFVSPPLAETEKKYYIYAKVSRSIDTGVFYISETAKSMDSEEKYYYLLMGLLNSEYAGDRSYVSLHGFTEILPGQITTDIIRDSEGRLLIDLSNALIIAKDGARINGDITIGPGSSGLENLEEWAGVQEKIDKAIADTDVEYYSSTSPTGLEGGEWSTTAPEWTQGRYIWSRTKVTYADGTPNYTEPVCITGNSGDGKGIETIIELYYLSTSPTELEGGEWSTTAPEWTQGKYIWTRSRIVYTDNTDTYTQPICVTGPAGSDGTPGTSVLAQYSADGDVWHETYQDGDIWMRTSSNNGDTWSPAIKIIGEDGKPGADGSYVAVEFAKNTSITEAPSSGWQDTPPSAHSGEYVWIRMGTVVPPAQAPSSWGNPIRITGDAGHDGEDVYLLDLSNEVATVSCDIDGNVISDMPECRASVYKGAVKTIPLNGYSAEFIGCSGKINVASGVITLQEITSDTAQVVVTADINDDGLILTATMTITKVYPGQPGQPGKPGDDGDDGKDAVLYYLLPSADKITKGFTGKIDPETVTCAKYRQVGNQTAVIDTTSSIIIKYQRLGEDESEVNYSGAVQITENTTALVFTLYSGSTVIDRERVPVMSDASDFQPGSGNLLKWSAFENIDEIVSLDCSVVPSLIDDTLNTGGRSVSLNAVAAMDKSDATHTISSVSVYYGRGTVSTPVPTSWSTTRPSLTSIYIYLYAYLSITYSNGKMGRTVPILIGHYYSGNAIVSVTPYYLASASEEASSEAGSWSTTRPSISASSPYLHLHFRTVYDDGTTVKSESVNAGCYNQTGLDLPLWLSKFEKGKNLIFSSYVQSASSRKIYITVEGATTDILEKNDGWLIINTSSSAERVIVNLGRITSVSNTATPCVRLRFNPVASYAINTPILEYGTVASDWSPARQDTEQKISDLDYLKQTFGQVTDIDGVVMSKMVAVKDAAGEVQAFMNGSDIGKDITHGKLLVAAGVSDIEHPETATTRIYEDGTSFMNNGNFSGSVKITGSEAVLLSDGGQIMEGGKIDSSRYSHIEIDPLSSYTIDDSAPPGTIIKIYAPPIITKLPAGFCTFTGGFVDVNEQENNEDYTVFDKIQIASIQRGGYIEMLKVDESSYKWMLISKSAHVICY